MSTFTRNQAREVARLNAEAARLIAEGTWTPDEFRRLREEIRRAAPNLGDAQSQIIRYARPEWISGLARIPLTRRDDPTPTPSASSTMAERLDWLRRRDAQGLLAPDERDELDELYRQLDREDRALLDADGERLLADALRDVERVRARPDVTANMLATCRALLQHAASEAVERERRYAHELAA